MCSSMDDLRDILVTRDLDDEQVAFANAIGLNPVMVPSIDITFRDNWVSVERVLADRERSVFAFTSQNGVKAFERFQSAGIELPKDIDVFAVGEKTAEALADLGYKAQVSDQQNGIGLGNLIIEEYNSVAPGEVTVIHFCGDKRRDEMRQILHKSGIDSKDVVVYQTELKKMHIPERQFEGVLFYSPSAVQAFRASGGFRADVTAELFAIGTTTAEELSIETGRHVHVSPTPKTEEFLKYVAEVLGASKQQIEK